MTPVDLEDPTHALILFLMVLTVLFIAFYGLGWTVLWLPTMIGMTVVAGVIIVLSKHGGDSDPTV